MEEESLSDRTTFQGIYTEQAPFEEAVRLGEYCLEEKPCLMAGSILLNHYQDTHVPLFLRKKEYAAHLSEKMERRVIYCTQITEEREATMHGLAGVGFPGDEDYDEFADGIYEQMKSIREDAGAKLERHNDFWDFMERWDHDSIYTNEERYLLGMMSASDYFDESIGRDVEAVNIQHKAWEEQQNLKYQLRKEKHRRMAEQYRQMITTKASIVERKMRVMETVQAVYYKGTLLALYLPKNAPEIWEIYGSGEVNPFHIAGAIYDMNKIGEGEIDLQGLFSYLAEAFGDILPRLTKPKPKPDGISNEAWELWMKTRMFLSFLE